MREKTKNLERKLKQEHFEHVAKAIKGGKESGSLLNIKLIEDLIESYKGKTIQAPLEVITTSSLLLDVKEIVGVIEALKFTIQIKMAKEIKEKIDKKEITEEDIMDAIMIAEIMNKKSKSNKHE